jgi:hypothetical protein
MTCGKYNSASVSSSQTQVMQNRFRLIERGAAINLAGRTSREPIQLFLDPEKHPLLYRSFPDRLYRTAVPGKVNIISVDDLGCSIIQPPDNDLSFKKMNNGAQKLQRIAQYIRIFHNLIISWLLNRIL